MLVKSAASGSGSGSGAGARSETSARGDYRFRAGARGGARGRDADAHGRHPGDAGVHGSGADRRRRDHSRDGYLRAGNRGLRNADGFPALCGRYAAGNGDEAIEAERRRRRECTCRSWMRGGKWWWRGAWSGSRSSGSRTPRKSWRRCAAKRWRRLLEARRWWRVRRVPAVRSASCAGGFRWRSQRYWWCSLHCGRYLGSQRRTSKLADQAREAAASATAAGTRKSLAVLGFQESFRKQGCGRAGEYFDGQFVVATRYGASPIHPPDASG